MAGRLRSETGGGRRGTKGEGEGVRTWALEPSSLRLPGIFLLFLFLYPNWYFWFIYVVIICNIAIGILIIVIIFLSLL